MNRPGFSPEPPLRKSARHGRRRANESRQVHRRSWSCASLESPEARIDGEDVLPRPLLLQANSIARVSQSRNCTSVGGRVTQRGNRLSADVPEAMCRKRERDSHGKGSAGGAEGPVKAQAICRRHRAERGRKRRRKSVGFSLAATSTTQRCLGFHFPSAAHTARLPRGLLTGMARGLCVAHTRRR